VGGLPLTADYVKSLKGNNHPNGVMGRRKSAQAALWVAIGKDDIWAILHRRLTDAKLESVQVEEIPHSVPFPSLQCFAFNERRKGLPQLSGLFQDCSFASAHVDNADVSFIVYTSVGCHTAGESVEIYVNAFHGCHDDMSEWPMYTIFDNGPSTLNEGSQWCHSGAFQDERGLSATEIF
jgi:hypothetical protein